MVKDGFEYHDGSDVVGILRRIFAHWDQYIDGGNFAYDQDAYNEMVSPLLDDLIAALSQNATEARKVLEGIPDEIRRRQNYQRFVEDVLRRMRSQRAGVQMRQSARHTSRNVQ